MFEFFHRGKERYLPVPKEKSYNFSRLLRFVRREQCCGAGAGRSQTFLLEPEPSARPGAGQNWTCSTTLEESLEICNTIRLQYLKNTSNTRKVICAIEIFLSDGGWVFTPPAAVPSMWATASWPPHSWRSTRLETHSGET